MSNALGRVTYPGEYVRGDGALREIGKISAKLGKKVFIMGGKTALAKVQQQIEDCLKKEALEIASVKWFGGESSWANVNAMTENAKASGADLIIAVGGGKAMDTGKMAAHKCGLPLITVPTVAATCASVAAVAVVYSANGEFEEVYEMDNAPEVVLVDTRVILEAPLRHLAAGLGDTLAKWYEYRVSIVKASKNGLSLGALANGRLCYDLILQYGGKAIESVKNNQFDEALNAAVDSIIIYAGTASLLGGTEVRAAAAHAFYNGLTVIPAAHAAGHGLTVGYGNLFLIALEGRSDEELLEAIQLSKACGVPTQLKELGDITLDDIEIASKAILANPDMDNMPFPVTKEMIFEAINRVDELAAKN